ncbi:hypothetical protein [Flavobacterium psychrotrophum]|uniref:hypothetical protein n=1 Tax=Flavobacterium psychrotrophum TaxID=2294119 RepID=UPI0013C47441|nr:hypothetical protein [Flavobacterium psychrotrophum]
MTKFCLCLTLILIASSNANAQDSIANTAAKAITEKFPATRTFYLQYDFLGPSDYKTELFRNDYERSRVKSHTRFKMTANLPVYKSKNHLFFITGTMNYKQESYSLGNVYAHSSQTVSDRDNQEFHYIAGAISATYFKTIFKKQIIYNATLTVDGNDKDVQRVKGLVSAAVVLKKTASTTITAGMVVILDLSTLVPIAPLFSFEHQFRNSEWNVDVILPQRFFIKRPFLRNGRISLGTELNSENYYINFNNNALQGTYELNQFELRSGVTYEYSLYKCLVGSFRCGMLNVVNSRVTKRGEKTSEYVIDYKQDPQYYFNVGFSYNPF